jgi:hypothetical protein
MKCTVCNVVGLEGHEMELIWSYRTDACESGCCETYVKLYQCSKCKTVKVEER